MWVYIVLSIVLVLFIIIFSIFLISKNKFQVLLVKINEADDNIDSLLRKKHEILLNIGNFIKDKTKEKTFDSLLDIDVDSIDSFELSDQLARFDQKVIEFMDYNKDINFDEEELNDFESFTDINIECLATQKYYNDNVDIFNKLLGEFPMNMYAKIKRFKEKETYLDEKEEVFEILKD